MVNSVAGLPSPGRFAARPLPEGEGSPALIELGGHDENVCRITKLGPSDNDLLTARDIHIRFDAQVPVLIIHQRLNRELHPSHADQGGLIVGLLHLKPCS